MNRTLNHGFTLVEVLMAASVLGFAVIALVQAVWAGQMNTYEAIHEARAHSLAEAMIDEVLSLPYSDPDETSSPGPETDETIRTHFDNADDYHGYTDAAGSIVDADAVLYPAAYQVFTRTVSAQYDTQTVTGFGTNPVIGLTVTVTVQDLDGRFWVLSRFIREPQS